MAGVLLWAPQDMWLSAQKQVWSHLWLDSFALLVLLPPLIWLLGPKRGRIYFVFCKR